MSGNIILLIILIILVAIIAVVIKQSRISYDERFIEKEQIHEFVFNAPFNGEVIRFAVNEGTEVKKKEEVMVFGSLKFAYYLPAPQSGTVHFLANQNQEVKEGEPLFSINYWE